MNEAENHDYVRTCSFEDKKIRFDLGILTSSCSFWSMKFYSKKKRANKIMKLLYNHDNLIKPLISRVKFEMNRRIIGLVGDLIKYKKIKVLKNILCC